MLVRLFAAILISTTVLACAAESTSTAPATWPHGAMASVANPYATDAAIEMLAEGGHVVDAAIAAHLVLGLVEPQSSGIGGGGFMLVPAMLYILGMSGKVVVGTSLFNILFVTMATTMTHALTTKAVDLVLAGLLLVGSVLGAQFGTRIALKLKPDWLRLALATIVLLVALRMLFGLSIQPDEVYSVVNL